MFFFLYEIDVYFLLLVVYFFFWILFETDNKNIIVTKGNNHIDVKTDLIFITRINQQLQEKDSGKNCKKKTVRQEVKKKRISQEYKNTRILPEDQDQFFQARILYRRNSKRILSDNQGKQESGKKDGKNVD
jgi:hypothetical protein